MPHTEGPPEPWASFFRELDGMLTGSVELHCFGGFVLIHAYGIARTTADVDFISVVPNPSRETLVQLGGYGSALHKRYRIYLDAVTVATPPDDYAARLKPLYPGHWNMLTLYALDAHDLALAKLERNFERDRDDVVRLARAGHLDVDVLRSRYIAELRPYLSRQSWHDGTLQMWIESCWPEESEQRPSAPA